MAHPALKWLLVISSAAHCAGNSADIRPSDPPGYVDGVLQRPLSIEEVEGIIAEGSGRLSGCYQRHRLSFGLEPPSSYVVRLRVPSDGTVPEAEVLEETEGGQEPLQQCLVEELEALRFPPHLGTPHVVDVPIRAPKR